MLGFSHSKPDLIVHRTKPLTAEPPLDRLRSGFVTKTADCNIRSHGNVPDLAAENAQGGRSGTSRSILRTASMSS